MLADKADAVLIVSLFFKLIPNIIFHINQEEGQLSAAEILITVCNKHEMHNLIAKTETTESPLDIRLLYQKKAIPPKLRLAVSFPQNTLLIEKGSRDRVRPCAPLKQPNCFRYMANSKHAITSL